jgi:hypothetical protein
MKTKQLSEHGRTFAKGGKGSPNKMFGQQSAGKATPGRSGKTQAPAPDKRAAAGGPSLGRGARSMPAKAAHTAPPTKGK